MAAYSESGPVFSARCVKVGLEEADVAALKRAGITTLARVAFMSSYTPGSGDDKELIAAFETALGGPASLGQKAAFRRLFHESFAVTTSEMRSLVERTDETAPRKLSVPERSERFAAIVKKLPGLDIRNRMEPSDALVDACVAIYEQNRLQYLEWDRLTSKEHEAQTSAKRESVLSIDSSGKLKTEKPDPGRADTSSEFLIHLALSRRGIAFEMANLLDFVHHSRWVEKLLSARLDVVPSTHNLPTFMQLQAADRKLFQCLADQTRAGLQVTASGRPLDQVFEAATCSTEVVNAPDGKHPRPPRFCIPGNVASAVTSVGTELSRALQLVIMPSEVPTPLPGMHEQVPLDQIHYRQCLRNTPLAGTTAHKHSDFVFAWALLGRYIHEVAWKTADLTAGRPEPDIQFGASPVRQVRGVKTWGQGPYEQGFLPLLMGYGGSHSRLAILPGPDLFMANRYAEVIPPPFVHGYGVKGKNILPQWGSVLRLPTLPESVWGNGDTVPLWASVGKKGSGPVRLQLFPGSSCFGRKMPYLPAGPPRNGAVDPIPQLGRLLFLLPLRMLGWPRRICRGLSSLQT